MIPSVPPSCSYYSTLSATYSSRKWNFDRFIHIYIYDYVYLHFMMLNARICISVSAVDLDLLVTKAAAPLGSYLPDWNKFVVDLGLRYLHTIARVSVRLLPMHDL